jgi:hypothetical protein
MKFDLHPACSAWPEMNPKELRDLADDIAAHGLRDPITVTPDHLLLDGRNRALACEMTGVEPTTTIFKGDPWLFSLSRNKHRRHLTTSQIAMIAEQLANLGHGGDRRSGDFKTSNEGLKISEVAKAAGVSKTDIESAKVVCEHGTPEEKEAVRTGKAKLRKTADVVRGRRRVSAEPDRPCAGPAMPLRKKAPVHSRDPIDDVVMRELITKCAGPNAEFRTLDGMSSRIQRAKNAIKPPLTRLGDAVTTRAGDKGDEYKIEGDCHELLVRTGLMMAQPEQSAANRNAETANLRAEIDYLRTKLADANAENERLRDENERLKTALHQSVERIAAKLIANGETQPTANDVVMNALG